jgi:uncharacterized membrane protein
VAGTPFADAINTEAVAEQVVGTVVGSVGLIAAVPLTTILAAFLARDLPERALRADHGHLCWVGSVSPEGAYAAR